MSPRGERLIPAVLRGGPADGRVMAVSVPLAPTVYTVQPAFASVQEMASWDEDPWRTIEIRQVVYEFTGTAKVTSRGEILEVYYQLRGT